MRQDSTLFDRMSGARIIRAHQPSSYCALFKLSRKVSNLPASI
jgi:hypothetical protein